MTGAYSPNPTVPPFPFLSERNGERAPLTPERGERSTLGRSGYRGGIDLGSPGFGAGVSTSPEVADSTGTPLTWNLHYVCPKIADLRSLPEFLQKVMLPRVLVVVYGTIA